MPGLCLPARDGPEAAPPVTPFNAPARVNCPPDRPHLSYTGERCWRPSQCGELTRPYLGGSPQLTVLPCKEQVKYRSGRHLLALFLCVNARPPLSPADGGGNPLKPRTGAEGLNLCSRTSNGVRRKRVSHLCLIWVFEFGKCCFREALQTQEF